MCYRQHFCHFIIVFISFLVLLGDRPPKRQSRCSLQSDRSLASPSPKHHSDTDPILMALTRSSERSNRRPHSPRLCACSSCKIWSVNFGMRRTERPSWRLVTMVVIEQLRVIKIKRGLAAMKWNNCRHLSTDSLIVSKSVINLFLSKCIAYSVQYQINVSFTTLFQ